ncbi:chemotaxis protein CheD [Candidatus Methylobacter oryzae]|uniref:Probable chemoreceptor glutamine deamidase CheD n=1 Tax=Candidatus Methylobacter oryzae TaxID=2497749 RepID=A0ABY3CF51_9GAMM|nr:chemotaxis protein CheD [Candidatus Methylobacter oryzae]TRX02119.1 chemotaxis protein CheD [Candidatus Methylobacter oryzae]
MQVGTYKGLPRIIIDPGESYVTKKNEIISTLLGSCVAACLYDPVNRVIGMNHFLLAQQHSAHTAALLGTAHKATLLGTESGRYGIHAMELLINQMLKQGAQRIHLKAKAFGGGDVLKLGNELRGGKSIGAINCEFIKTFLRTEKIPLVASALGGDIGRNIFFLTSDFSVYVKSIERDEELTILHQERRFLKKNTGITLPQPLDQADFW